MAKPTELLIQRGSTFVFDVLLAQEKLLTYKAITAISLANGAPRLTVTNHGLPTGWPVAITRVAGMKQINAQNSPPRDSDYVEIVRIDANTIELNGIDATGFSAYTSGGFIQFKTPLDFAGYTARMDIKDKVGGTILASSDVDTASLNILDIDLAPTDCRVRLTVSAADTAAITWNKGVTDLEMVSPLGVVFKPKLTSSGGDEEPNPVRVVGEVTTSS